MRYWSYLEEYKNYRSKILKSVDKTLKSGNLFFGKELLKFEKNFIKANKLRYGVAVGSGTDALLLALRALNINKIGYASLNSGPQIANIQSPKVINVK